MSRRALLTAFSIAHFAHHVTNSLFSALVPFIRETFAMSNTQIGFAVTAYPLAWGFSTAPRGVLAARLGARRVIVGGLFLIALTSIAIGLSGSYAWLLVGLVIMGIASGSYHAPASALIAETFPFARRGVALRAHTTARHLAVLAAPLLPRAPAVTRTWRVPYLPLSSP